MFSKNSKSVRWYDSTDPMKLSLVKKRIFILLPVVAASPDRNQRATSKPTVTLTRNVSSPLAIGTGAAIAADPPCARIGTGEANPESLRDPFHTSKLDARCARIDLGLAPRI